MSKRVEGSGPTAAFKVLKKEEAAPLPVCAEVQVRKMMSCSHCGRLQTFSGICSTGSSHFTLLAKLRGKQRKAEASLYFRYPAAERTGGMFLMQPGPGSSSPDNPNLDPYIVRATFQCLRQHKLVPELLMVIPALTPAVNPNILLIHPSTKPLKLLVWWIT